MIRRPRSGFTLIELSVVLVIIGLIVGGVLVAQSLTRTAAIRSVIGQIESYNSAVNAFKTRYNFLPGDLPAQKAAQFGFTARSGLGGRGDGDGYICDTNGALGDCAMAAGETVLFWTDLSQAGLVAGNFTNSGAAPVSTTTPEQILPLTKLRRNLVFASSVLHTALNQTLKRNGFQLVTTSRIFNGSIWTSAGLTPIEAYAIDQKLDDSLPLTGKALAMTPSANFPGITGPPGWTVAFYISTGQGSPHTDCVQAGTPVSYSTANSAFADIPNCSLSIAAQW